MRIENLILRHLMHDEGYMRRVIPFLNSRYFVNFFDRFIFEKINEFINKYNTAPSLSALEIEVNNANGVSEKDFENVVTALTELTPYNEKKNEQWLVDETEKFCQEKAVYNAIMDSISIIDGKTVNLNKAAIPQILSDALGVSFDTNIGHDLIENADNRFEFYHLKRERLQFDIKLLNDITDGGIPKKTLNVFLGGIGAGKTLTLCHLAAANFTLGKNVLYITLEMSEEEIAKRIDANLLDSNLYDLLRLSKDTYDRKIARIKSKYTGKIIIKEFPTAGAHVGHFRHLLNDLQIKKNFKPDAIYIDYLNICQSARIKLGGSVNTYVYVKNIAEEIRGLAIEFNVPIFSASQLTRTGSVNSDPEMTDTSESFGLPATCDFLAALVVNEELLKLDQMMIKQLKNRFGDINQNRKFVVGVDRGKMRLYDVEDGAQTLIEGDVSVMDNTTYGTRRTEEETMVQHTKFRGRKDFSGLKVS